MDKKSRTFLVFYLIIHILAFSAFGLRAALKGVKISADLFSMIPQSREEGAAAEALKIADEKLTQNSSKAVFILSRSPDFETAKVNAEIVYQKIKLNPQFDDLFESLTLYSGEKVFSPLMAFLRHYRLNLLPQGTLQKLSTEEGRLEFSEDATAQIFSGFTLSSLDYLEEDPFLLDEINLKKFLQILQNSGTNMSLKDDVLAAEYKNEWFVMIQGSLTAKGAALASKNNAVNLIYDSCLPMEKAYSDAKFVFSGTPFHSHKSSTNASREISIISTISLLAVLLMLIFTFRTALPIAAAFASILISLAFAFCVTTSIFGSIHALTLVFGTSLIGSCIDYSLHFFVNWKARLELKSGSQIKNFLLKGLTLSLASTEICYLLLIFTPFPLLRQMAVFSLTGILSSFLTVICLYPLFPLQNDEKRFFPDFQKKFLPEVRLNFKPLKSYILFLLILIPLIIIAVNHKNLRIHNDLSALYKMQGRLKDDTILSSKVLNYTPSSWFVLQAKSQEELLQKEEDFALQFQKGTGSAKYLCLSSIIPSQKLQASSIAAGKNLLENYSEGQFENLGFDDSKILSSQIKKRLSLQQEILTPDSELPEQIRSIKDMLWLGKIGDNYYSVFMPTANFDPKVCKALAQKNTGIFYQNKVGQISEGLNHISRLILIMFGIAFVIISFTLRLFFSARQTRKITGVPLFSLLWILAVFTATKTPLDFFCITGIILVFGLGIDYIIYMTQHEGGKLERAAIILSFLTTALSFGALALSSFVPVHAIGLAIFTGLTAAFVATMES